jgi:flavin-dependent dehydrogenase
VIGVTDGTTEYRAAVTVGADGTHSLLARTLGIVRPIRRLQRLALVGHFTGFTASDDGEATVTMHLPSDRSDACCGIGAPVGPDGARNVNIVVPITQGSQMAGRREAYFQERLQQSFPRVWEQFTQARPVGPLRSIGCFGHHTTRATHDGAVLVGDAATFINPFTGEGVFFALRGAQLAAEAIDDAMRKSDVSRLRLQCYDAARRSELLPRYRLCDLVQRVVHSPRLLMWAAARLRRSPSLTDLLLNTVGDLGRPHDLCSFQTLRLALAV